MAPTIAEVIFWSVLGVCAIAALVAAAVINPGYDPEANDPYRYCPKDEN